jgi:phosphatidylglycerol:prolipoprotein diacylglycerol transferase
MLYFYQHLPYFLDPVVFSLGSFSLRWYSLMYIVGLVTVYFLLMHRIERREISNVSDIGFLDKYQLRSNILDFLLYAFASVLLGGRLGYVLFYNPTYYAKNPSAIFSPFDSSGEYVGIYGMSYFGAFIAVVIMTWIFCHRRRLNFWLWGDFIAPAIPAGYFFGRIGNFLNGELYGRVTSLPWGMYFPSDTSNFLRHPSQIYEAMLEGLLLFMALWTYRNRAKFPGQLLILYAGGYALVRFFCEYFRQEDLQTGLLSGKIWTSGQTMSLFLGIIVVMIYIKKGKCDILEKGKRKKFIK